MEPLLAAAANALAAGDPLRALTCVSLRDDAAALALRGIAMAQLGDLTQAARLLKRAARAFGPKHAVAHARCILAGAEIAFVSRDSAWPLKPLESALATLESHGDSANALHARHLLARRALLLGDASAAERVLAGTDPAPLPHSRRAAHEMILADLAMRRLKIEDAREAFSRAMDAAARSGIPALRTEVAGAARALELPAARQITCGRDRLIVPAEVAALLGSGALVIDACRRFVRKGGLVVPLAARPVLFALARALAEAAPADVSRDGLVRAAFAAKQADESHRARLRVEIGRLRRLLQPIATLRATRGGFVLRPRPQAEIHLLTWPVEEEHGAVLAFLTDGEAWSSAALALALGVSQRTVQRSLEALAAEHKVRGFGHARARRWTIATVSGFTTTMLLPTLLG